VEQNYSAVFTYHSPFSTIITVSPVLAVRVDVVLSVSMAGFLLSSSDVELLRVFDAVVGLASVIFPGSLQSKLLFEQSVENVEELVQFIGAAAFKIPEGLVRYYELPLLRLSRFFPSVFSVFGVYFPTFLRCISSNSRA